MKSEFYRDRREPLLQAAHTTTRSYNSLFYRVRSDLANVNATKPGRPALAIITTTYDFNYSYLGLM